MSVITVIGLSRLIILTITVCTVPTTLGRVAAAIAVPVVVVVATVRVVDGVTDGLRSRFAVSAVV